MTPSNPQLLQLTTNLAKRGLNKNPLISTILSQLKRNESDVGGKSLFPVIQRQDKANFTGNTSVLNTTINAANNLNRNFLNLAPRALNLALDTVRQQARGGAGIPLQALSYATGQNQTFVPTTGFEKALFGTNIVKPTGGQGGDFLSSFGASDDFSKKYGLAVGATLTAMDLMPGGGGKDDLAKGVVKKSEVANKLLKDIMTGEYDKVAKTATKRAKDLIADGYSPNYFAVKQQKNAAKAALEEADRLMSKTDPSLEEAKKYKSAEEFVSSGKKLYRGGTSKDQLFVGSRGKASSGQNVPALYFTDKPEVADLYKRVEVAKGNQGASVLEENFNPKLFKKVKYQDAAPYLTGQKQLEDGYIGIYHPENNLIGGRETTSNTYIQLKTKQQLTNIYNKAKKGTDSVYRYHTTSPKAFSSIQKQGLKPSRGMYGKGVYFSPKVGAGESSGEGLIIRAKKDTLSKKYSYGEFTDEGWAEKTVMPEDLEYSRNNGKTWFNLTNKKLK